MERKKRNGNKIPPVANTAPNTAAIYAHAAPKNITHGKCNFNPKYKGWMPKWVCNKLEIKYKEWDKFKH